MSINEILDQFYNGLLERKGDINSALLHLQFQFSDPIETCHSREEFLEDVKKYASIIHKVSFLKRYWDDDSACVIYKLTTTWDTPPLLTVEFFKFAEGKIIELTACYDPREFLKRIVS